ncbi:hypothetical protein GGS21DRAFT_51232 [Xylaria nigripes]|nr:hypothetical protein GGS21DRAFT_51232 [Xylaria nigripes]
MTPPSGSLPRPARSASGHVKKQNSAPAPASAAVATTHRPNVVLPAIPFRYMNKQSNIGTAKTTAAAKSPPNHAPTTSTSSNGLVPSLDVALLENGPAGPTNIGVESQDVEKSGYVAVPPSSHEQQPQASWLQVNGVDHTGTDPTLGAGYGAVTTQGASGDSSYVSQPHLADSTTQNEFAPSVPTLARPLPHQQPMVDQHHPAPFNAPHPHHMHLHQHGHQSSNGGGIMFGAFDSHTPSPAPPFSGFMPPPHPPMNGENRGPPPPNSHHHTHSNSSGFPGPINTRFRENMPPMSTMDAYGLAPGPLPPVHIEPYAPGAGRYGPPTPHSFHGSHASGEPNGIENAPLPYHPSGSYAHAHHHPPGPIPPFIVPQPYSRQFNFANEEVIGGVNYIRSLFRVEDLSDCILELISARERHPPVTISAHKLILARSPVLRQLILTPGVTYTITIETNDAYLRSDAWVNAIQHLYLYQHQLPHPHDLVLGNAGNGMNLAGDRASQFSFCLGYAASGNVLAMPDIIIRGLEVAASILTWDTIETGLGFVLENTIQRHFDHGAEPEEASPSTFLEFGYGRDTEILLAAILNFLVGEFPPNFELDTSVLDTSKIARIPMSATTRTTTTTTTTATATTTSQNARATRKAMPAIARGTIMRQPAQQARLSSIKFGDLPAAYPDDGALLHREPAKCSSVLSLILLNLPYDQLCHVLTSGSNGVSGWSTAQDRYHAVAGVVAEREERRLRAVEAVRSGAVPHAPEIQSRLSAPHRYTVAKEWDVLNWREEVVHDEMPRIIRRWIPQFDVAQQPTQQASPLYDIPDSMV